jgi:glycosyltransferase involved in cell wall biosynthesis
VRILLSTPYLGGTGGIERHVASTIRCLSARHEVDVCAKQVIESEYLVRPRHGRVIAPYRRRWPKRHSHPVAAMVWPVVEPFVRYRPQPYDAYLHYQWADDVRDRFQAATSLVIPCGDDVRHVEHDFDIVALEAPDNDRWVGDHDKAALLPPPLDVPALVAEPVAGLPEKFFLTVFNPHVPRKGFDDMRAVAGRSSLPIVWCRGTKTRPIAPLPDVPGVTVLEDLSQAQLRCLYERCHAFVEFGCDMGFAWSVADALQYGAPVISRRAGVLSLPGLDDRGVHTFETVDELAVLVGRTDYVRVSRDLSDLAPERFVERFELLAG